MNNYQPSLFVPSTQFAQTLNSSLHFNVNQRLYNPKILMAIMSMVACISTGTINIIITTAVIITTSSTIVVLTQQQGSSRIQAHANAAPEARACCARGCEDPLVTRVYWFRGLGV